MNCAGVCKHSFGSAAAAGAAAAAIMRNSRATFLSFSQSLFSVDKKNMKGKPLFAENAKYLTDHSTKNPRHPRMQRVQHHLGGVGGPTNGLFLFPSSLFYLETWKRRKQEEKAIYNNWP